MLSRGVDTLAGVYVLSWLVRAVWDLRPAAIRSSRCLAGSAGQRWWECPDLDDPQWRALYSGSTYLLLFSAVHLCVSAAVKRVRPGWWASVTAALGVAFVLVLHGGGGVLLLATVGAFGGAVHSLPTWAVLPTVWVGGIGMLLLLDHTSGLRDIQVRLGVDSLPVLSRWENHFNLTLLRLISFGHEVVQQRRSPRHTTTATPATILQTAARQSDLSPISDGVFLFWTYLLYPPLYLTGPIISYKDFVRAVSTSPGEDPGSRTVSPPNDAGAVALTAGDRRNASPRSKPPPPHLGWYAVRLGVALAVFECLTRYLQPWSVGRVTTGWRSHVKLPPGGLYALAYFTLMAISLKFVVIWRFHRLWALVDGVPAPENMTRCMSKPCGIREFWQGWHVSFHHWLVAHIYIPLGGNRHGPTRTALHTATVFLFVAFWHDRNTRMLFWGPLLAVAASVEMGIEVRTQPMLTRLAADRPWIPRAVHSVGRTSAATALVLVNMLGFSQGQGLMRGGLRGRADLVAGADFIMALLCAAWLSDPALLRSHPPRKSESMMV